MNADQRCCARDGPGRHARTSVGVYQLPKDASVELDLVAAAKAKPGPGEESARQRFSPAPTDEPGRYAAGGAVLLQRSQDDALSVWLRGSDHWPTSAALGRYLARALGCEVRCEPEPAHGVDPHSNVFLRITPAGEGLVTWA